MDLNIKIEDYLTKVKIAEICEDEIRRALRNAMFTEKNLDRILTNNAYHIIHKCIDEYVAANETFESVIESKVKEILDSGLHIWDIFREADAYGNKESVGMKLLNKAIEDSRPQIAANVEKVIADYPYMEIKNEIKDVIYEVIERKIFEHDKEKENKNDEL